MEIKLDSTALGEIMSQAVLASMDQVSRETLIKGAIQHLITPPPGDTYNRKPKSPLQSAFEVGIENTARKLAVEIMSNDAETERQMRALLMEAVNRVWNDKREETIEKIARSLRDGMSSRD